MNNSKHKEVIISQTPLQKAYQIGSSGGISFSAPAYYYQEYEANNVNIEALKNAVIKTVENHESLRSYPLSNMKMKIGGLSDKKCFEFIDLSSVNNAEFFSRKTNIIYKIKNDSDEYHNLYLCVMFHGDKYYISNIYKLSAFDAYSISIVQKNIADLYRNISQNIVYPQYRDYIEKIDSIELRKSYLKAKEYWDTKIPTMKGPPKLPYSKDYLGKNKSTFVRLSHTISEQKYAKLNKMCLQNGVSISSLLFTLYCDVLKAWSEDNEFTINVMLSHREVDSGKPFTGVGNCSSTILTEYRFANETLLDRVRNNYIEILKNITAIEYSGVNVIRDYADYNGISLTNPVMPVVFTSTIGLDVNNTGFLVPISGWKYKNSALSTPQVILDYQIFENKSGLIYNWDYVQKSLPDGLVEMMFWFYNEKLEYLADNEAALNEKTNLKRYGYLFNNNNTEVKTHKSKLIHQDILSSMSKYPERNAIQSKEKTITFEQLHDLISRTAKHLCENGVEPGDIVSVLCKKGWLQTVSVLSILVAGGIYLPMNRDNPRSRNERILSRSRCKYILTDEKDVFDGCTSINIITAMSNNSLMNINTSMVKASDPAYIIFTSGSTGEPKGVAISHESAVNTIDDVAKRFHITKDSKAIALSSLNFDLSVFDIFGILGVGGTLVYPENTDNPDPYVWINTVNDYGVNIWNSVPAYFQMAISVVKEHDLNSLNTIMLSGDWVKKELVDNIMTHIDGVKVVALGGATEASIWSNYFIASEEAYETTCVPYGYPLKNQTLHVLDENMEVCPIWKEGDLYIGGNGVGLGYVNDKSLTEASFVTEKNSQNKLYKTGDRARFMSDGVVEFLGRNDFQIKIRGHRIELGEIDSIANKIPYIKSAVSFVCNANKSNAFIVLAIVKNMDIDANTVIENISKELPDYMVPREIIELDELPLSKNGKIDREILTSRYLAKDRKTNIQHKPKTDDEKQIYRIWQSILGIDDYSIKDSFFDIGGDSISAVSAMVEIGNYYHKTYPINIIFQNQTVEQLARSLHSDTNNNYIKLASGSNGTVILLPPVGGNLICYKNYVESFDGFDVYGLSLNSKIYDQNTNNISLIELSDIYVKMIINDLELKRVILCGWSMGGTIAYYMALSLSKNGVVVDSVHMIDSYIGKLGSKKLPDNDLVKLFYKDILGTSNEKLIDNTRLSEYRDNGSSIKEDLKSFFIQFKYNYNILASSRDDIIDHGVYDGKAYYYKADNDLDNRFPSLEPIIEAIRLSDDSIVVYRDRDHFSILDEAFNDIRNRITPKSVEESLV